MIEIAITQDLTSIQVQPSSGPQIEVAILAAPVLQAQAVGIQGPTGTSGGVTNLSYDAETRVVESDTGAGATLPLAGPVAGLMSPEDKARLDGIVGQNTGDQVIVLTGDVTGSGTGTFATTLAVVNAAVGSFGLANSVAQFTVNAKGLVTSAVNLAISIASSAISDATAAGRAMLTAATAADQTSLLDVFTSLVKGLVPASGGGTEKFLRADAFWAYPTMLLAETAATNTVIDAGRIEARTTGTPANGIGAGLLFAAETSAGNVEVGARIDAVAQDVTVASEDFYLAFKTMANGAAAAERMRISPTGLVGIGTLNPGAELHVRDAFGPCIVQITSTATGTAAIYLGDDGDGDVGNIKYENNGDYMTFTANTAEVMRLSGGYLRMAAGTLGIQFGGDTAPANALNDYERGTWTPVVADAATGGNVATAALAAGQYVKVGDVVVIDLQIIDITTTGLAAGNTLYVRGLPFASKTSSLALSYIGGSFSSINSTDGVVFGAIESAAAVITMRQGNPTGGNVLTVAGVVSGSGDMRMNGTYLTA